MKKEVKRSWLFFLWVLCFMIPIEALAQRITVEGIVTDSNGEPIIGATVIEKGNKTNGVVTDLDGKFSITVSEKKKVLVITYIGMKPQEVVSQPGKLLKVKMEDESQLLDEVVVVSVGYGNARKRDLTGAISSVGVFITIEQPKLIRNIRV